ncbi:hypothetical protein ACFQI7_31540 [Paenibacillus allorhizosphaerae]|uniref:PepSY domain-containing protein n=1 Tax=Paenibacillus allorhizosphaerae TaxID=2849866 RepID=A0ABM8VQ11_9BACL|nr:hypothetical protein [Paenibacillus allorhizosphaerae]CAG7653574.1 hypothetical protein PAECIP111802_05525 [Paenibacillus allorhizosphaerae]
MKKKLIILAALVLLTAAGCTDASQPAKPPAPPAPGANNSQAAVPEPPAGAAQEPVVTKQQIDSVPMESTFDEVAKKIGLGKLVKKNENQVVYQYKGKNGGTAQLTFWQGKLNSVGYNDFKE